MVRDRNPLAYTGRIQARTDLYGDDERPISGTATLVLGVATVALTQVKSNSVVVLSTADPNASTALGTPFVVATPGVGFTITSLDAALPSTEVGDLSDISWMVFTPEVN